MQRYTDWYTPSPVRLVQERYPSKGMSTAMYLPCPSGPTTKLRSVAPRPASSARPAPALGCGGLAVSAAPSGWPPYASHPGPRRLRGGFESCRCACAPCPSPHALSCPPRLVPGTTAWRIVECFAKFVVARACARACVKPFSDFCFCQGGVVVVVAIAMRARRRVGGACGVRGCVVSAAVFAWSGRCVSGGGCVCRAGVVFVRSGYVFGRRGIAVSSVGRRLNLQRPPLRLLARRIKKTLVQRTFLREERDELGGATVVN